MMCSGKKGQSKRLIDRSGLTRETIYRARRNDGLPSCSIRTLEIIARALDVKVKDLFEEV
jgi:DNA-binding Xre family transcriptional regulator